MHINANHMPALTRTTCTHMRRTHRGTNANNVAVFGRAAPGALAAQTGAHAAAPRGGSISKTFAIFAKNKQTIIRAWRYALTTNRALRYKTKKWKKSISAKQH